MTVEHFDSPDDVVPTPDDLDSGVKGRVLRFRPRNAASDRALQPPPPPIEDLGKFERSNEPDDFRHRMKMNGLVLVVTIILIAIGIWIADTKAQMRKNQDCVLTGRSASAPITVPPRPR